MDPRHLSIESFTYDLPEEKIAFHPLEERSASKLLVYQNGGIQEATFQRIGQWLKAGDRLVFNETKVIHARLRFQRPTGSVIEILCLEPDHRLDPSLALQQRGCSSWKAMIGNRKRWKEPLLTLNFTLAEETIILTAECTAEEVVTFTWDDRFTFSEVIEAIGELPLPPYLNRDAEEQDEVRYQTVYAKNEGSVAAPTAGLHFTDAILSELNGNGIRFSSLTLHVGAGTFKPVKSETMEGHPMHEEKIVVSRQTVVELIEQLKNSERIIAVGTTSLRTLESLYWMGVKSVTGVDPSLLEQWFAYDYSDSLPTPTEALGALLDFMDARDLSSFEAFTRLLISPGFRFHIADGLITNFHQPGSTLLLLVAAWTGGDWRAIYDFALTANFRFLSYGDSSLLFRHL